MKIPPGQESSTCNCPRCSGSFVPQSGPAAPIADSKIQPTPPLAPLGDIFQDTPPPETPLNQPPSKLATQDPASQTETPASNAVNPPTSKATDKSPSQADQPPLDSDPLDSPDNDGLGPLENLQQEGDSIPLLDDPLAPLDSLQSAAESPQDEGSERAQETAVQHGTVDPMYDRKNLKPTPVAKRKGADEIFAVTCSVCSARVDVTRDQIGSTVSCPDCYLAIPVHAPKERAPEPKIDIDNAETFTFSDQEQAEELDSKSMTEHEKYAHTAMEKAREELDRPKDESGYIFDEYDFEKLNSNIKILGFIGQPTIWPRWLMYSMGLTVILSIYSIGVSFYEVDNLFKVFISFLITAVGTAGLGVWILFVSPALLTIFSITGGGEDKVETFPAGAPQEFISEFSTLAVSLLYSSMVGMGLAFLGSLVGLSSIFGAALIIVSAVVFHPVVFLSLVHSQSLLTPCSPDIVRTFSLAKDKWIRLYLFVALMGFVSWALVAPVLIFGVIFALPAGIIITLNLLLYFRLLGKLVFECGELMNLENVSQGEETAAQESGSTESA